ncbi:MAG: TonB-dependent receptor [Alcaligenaceae bacterium]
MRTFKLKRLAFCLAGLSLAPSVWSQPVNTPSMTATNVGRIQVEGLPGGTATGLIVQEDTPKMRSSVNREAIEKLTPLANPYQMIDLLPGVNTFSQDATGLFGGGIRVRGANSDQLGFTVNGAPVNDSGNFAVYPMEYVDAENICEVYLTQGGTDTDAPHVGASGGNIGISYCAPDDKSGFRFAQTIGSLNSRRTYVRADTGLFANDKAKFFVSYSNTYANQFQGPGNAQREHVDMGLEIRPDTQWRLTSNFSFNKMFNNNFRTLTQQQIDNGGRDQTFSANPAVNPTPGFGTAQTVAAVTADNTYYQNSVNPFINVIWSGKAEYKMSKDVTFSAEPYFWYGHGTGGTQQRVLAESAYSGSTFGYGVADLNKDRDTLDRLYVYSSNVTETYRPGITLKTNVRIDNHDLMVGAWLERARHLQTGPALAFDSSGGVSDPWLFNTNQYLQYGNGQNYQSRNWQTISTSTSLFAQDTIKMLEDKLLLQLGVRGTQITRDFTNYANSGSTNILGASTADYDISKTYGKVLPNIGVRYRLDEQQQVFANVAQNMRVPNNSALANLLVGGKVVDGVLTGASLRDPEVKMETSTNFDLGYRFSSDKWTFASSLYYIDFQNRIASAYDVTANQTIDFNVGSVVTKGAELEAGYKINNNWSMYGSATYNISNMKNDLPLTATASLPTAGAQLPDTPNWMTGLRVSYQSNTWYGNLDMKYTGSAYSTLVNDEKMPAYTLFNGAVGYRFEDYGLLKNPSVQFNVYNIFNTNYQRISSPSGSGFTPNAVALPGLPAVAPSYYIGAPTFVSVTFRAGF